MNDTYKIHLYSFTSVFCYPVPTLYFHIQEFTKLSVLALLQFQKYFVDFDKMFIVEINQITFFEKGTDFSIIFHNQLSREVHRLIRIGSQSPIKIANVDCVFFIQLHHPR